MSSLTALFIGGNGTISSAASRMAVEAGIDVTLLNRARSSQRPPIAGARTVVGDASDPGSVRAAVGADEFDVVVNFQSFLPEQARFEAEFFQDRVGQYVYISSAAGYQKPVSRLPITESTPLRNPFWQYARDKIASETVFTEAYRESAFPVTIVRPSHTYDPSLIPLDGGWTVLDRILRGKEVVVHGDGTSLWTLTHHVDFGRALVGLLGNARAVGDAFQITSDEALPWDQIVDMFASALGVSARITHVSADTIVKTIPEWGPGLLGDKMHSVVFDNSKIKAIVPGWAATVPFWRGAREIVEWYGADPARRSIDADLNDRLDALVARAI
jgi:nucleoside-diphosphate-sugar epimerase